MTAAAIVLSLAWLAACAGSPEPAPPRPTLRIGFGLTSGVNPAGGIRQAARNLALEGLVRSSRTGRPQPWLADSWSLSDDGLMLHIRLKPDVRFHDGQPLTAETVRASLVAQLEANMGPVAGDIRSITAVSPLELTIAMHRRSTFVLEALDVGIAAPGHPLAGTGPFSAGTPAGNGAITMQANDAYREGPPGLAGVSFQPYTSVRAAWADLLRGEVDMLYEVGIDALDSLETSTRVRVFTHPRNYAYQLILNVRRPALRDPQVRRLLNAAIDRHAIVQQVLGGHGRPADGPVLPDHWAHDPTAPRFTYAPQPLAAPLRITCLFGDGSLERLAVALQRQLQAVGVEMTLERVGVDQIYDRTSRGDFDVILADVAAGPTLVRPLWFWYSQAQFNWGGYSNADVDHALDRVREARDDAAYRAGVAAFERAMVADPPAVFVAWSERARAVSTAFDVPAEPGRDVLGSLPSWRPARQAAAAAH